MRSSVIYIVVTLIKLASLNLQPIIRRHESTKRTTDHVESGPIEIEIDSGDPGLNIFDVYDGSGDHRFPEDLSALSSHMTSEIYVTIESANQQKRVRPLSHSTEGKALISATKNPMFLSHKNAFLYIRQKNVSLKDIHMNFLYTTLKLVLVYQWSIRVFMKERALLKGDKGDMGPPGTCIIDTKRDFGIKGDKGDPGITEYLVKVVGKDGPLANKDIFAQFIKRALDAGLKGAKGDPGRCERPLDEANVVALKDSSRLRFGVRHNGVLYDLEGHELNEPA
ncbi:hypothetical protein ACOME3_005293 [Neoechinorhynchus agilis]